MCLLYGTEAYVLKPDFILKMSVTNALVITQFLVQNVRSGFIVTAKMCLGTSFYLHVNTTLSFRVCGKVLLPQ